MNKQNNSNYLATAIWLVLVVLTIVSFCLGETGMQGKEIMLLLLAITMVKSQLVANYFMGLKSTRLLWRGIMFGYFVVVGGLIAVAYLKSIP